MSEAKSKQCSACNWAETEETKTTGSRSWTSTESQSEVPLLRNCSNCQRTELHQHDESLSLTRISEYDIQQNKKGKFSMLAGESWECWKYFCGEKLVYGTAGGVVWPSFIWKSLTSITRDQRLLFWSFMPEGWRLWWLPKKAKRLNGLRYATVMWPKLMIDDAMVKIKEINKVKEELKWKDIEKTWDELCCLPFVHCPWGCREFYHRFWH